MAITINTDSISDEQKKTEKFKRAYREMYTRLSVPEFAHAVCCHEAAHLYYLTIAGMKNYDAFPAELYYDPTIGDYGGTLASIQPRDLKALTTEEEAKQWLWTVLKSHAAGGVVSRKVMPLLLDHGDQDDKQRFMALCEKMRNGNSSINPDDLWKQAQEAVSKELADNPKAMAALEKFADEELRPQLGLN